jgi:Bacterial Ig-like domain (group 2)
MSVVRLRNSIHLFTFEKTPITMKSKLILLALACCFSCVTVDFKDDTIRSQKITILSAGKLVIIDNSGGIATKGSNALLGLLVGEKQLVNVEYYNEYGVKKDPTLTWTIAKPAVASVSKNEITALSAGTTLISGTVGEVSVTINLTVVADNTTVASVIVAPPASTTLQINQTVQLSATAKSIDNTNLSGKTYEWFSENSNIVSISTTGLVTAKADGTAEVHAKVEGVKSNSIRFNVGATANMRTGTFQSAGGYSSVGSVTVEETSGKLIVKLSNDFQASVALGTFIYLANSTTGSAVKSAGLELGQWSSGAKTFEAAGVTLNQYKYVVVLCKPAGVIFGFAELKP